MKKLYRWRIPSAVTEFRGVCVEAATQAEAMQRYRNRDWVEGDDADDARSVVRKVGKIERLDEAES